MFAEILLLLALSPLLSQTSSPAYDDVDAYEVYAAVLPSEWPTRVAHAKQLVIRRETTSYEMCLRPDPEIRARVGPAIANYLKLNEKEWLLQPRLTWETPYQFLESKQFGAIQSQGGWNEYYRLYPESGGLIVLSAVGFNPDKTIAVVYMAHSCGNLCGGGTFHVLEKIEDKWKPLAWKGSSCAWAS